MAIGRISGSVLKSNLTRNGTDLAFETNLLYLDVTNSRVGIGTSEPSTALQVNGTITATTVTATNLTVGGATPITGKSEGTNFTGGLIVGHSTTGTLSSAEKNTAVGLTALDAITSGNNNVAVGHGSLTTNTIGLYNTAVGMNSSKLLLDGDENVSIGYNSVRTNTTGDRNVGVGGNSLYWNSSGHYNTAIGHDGLKLTTGNYNTGLGYRAGDNITSGVGNVIIGSVDAASATGDRQLMITGYDGTNTTTWLKGDSSGVVTLPADVGSSSSTTGTLVVTGGVGVSEDIYVGADIWVNDDINLGDYVWFYDDGQHTYYGADSDVRLTHDHDKGLILKNRETGDDTPTYFTLQTGETTITVDDKIGVIDFQAPNESAGTDAITVAAGIEAVAEGTFAADNNATKLSFKTASSGTATEKMSLSSGGNLTVSGAVGMSILGSDPSGETDAAHIYAKDDTSSAEVYVRDEAGNVTKLSPHNKQGEWEYFSRNVNTGKVVRVNMEELVRDIEKLTGKKYIKEE